MKVQLQLEVSQQQFFDLITTSLLNEIKMSANEDVHRDELHGYRYTKTMTTKMGANSKVDVEITNYQYPHSYEAKIRSKNGDYVFRYDVEAIDDSHCRVSYEETYHSDKWNLRLNYAILSWLYVKSSQKRLIASIRHMEQLILHPELMEKQAVRQG